MSAFRRLPGHRFPVDDVSIVDPDVQRLLRHRQVTDAHLLTLACRHGARTVTFGRGLAALAEDDTVELVSS